MDLNVPSTAHGSPQDRQARKETKRNEVSKNNSSHEFILSPVFSNIVVPLFKLNVQGLNVYRLLKLSVHGLSVYGLFKLSVHGLSVYGLFKLNVHELSVYGLFKLNVHGLRVYGLFKLNVHGLSVYGLFKLNVNGLFSIFMGSVFRDSSSSMFMGCSSSMSWAQCLWVVLNVHGLNVNGLFMLNVYGLFKLNVYWLFKLNTYGLFKLNVMGSMFMDSLSSMFMGMFKLNVYSHNLTAEVTLQLSYFYRLTLLVFVSSSFPLRSLPASGPVSNSVCKLTVSFVVTFPSV